MASGLRVAGEETPEIAEAFHELGVKMSQNNYVELLSLAGATPLGRVSLRLRSLSATSASNAPAD
jgi:hypothetical protein